MERRDAAGAGVLGFRDHLRAGAQCRTSIGAFALFTTDLPAAAGIALFLLPLPYNLFVCVAVWRSAARYAGPRHWADAARIAVVLWVIAATLV